MDRKQLRGHVSGKDAAKQRRKRKRRRDPKARNLAPDYNATFLEGLDKRTYLYRVIRDREQEILSDLGGAETLSYFKRSLVRHAVWLEAMMDMTRTRVALNADEIGRYTQMLNAYSGLAAKLGLARKARDVHDLQSYLEQRKDAAGADADRSAS
jgi:hypothetical protein